MSERGKSRHWLTDNTRIRQYQVSFGCRWTARLRRAATVMQCGVFVFVSGFPEKGAIVGCVLSITLVTHCDAIPAAGHTGHTFAMVGKTQWTFWWLIGRTG